MTSDNDEEVADVLSMVNREYARQQAFPAGILNRLLDFVMWPDRPGAKAVAHDIWVHHTDPGGYFLCAAATDRAVMVAPTAALDELTLAARHVYTLRALLKKMGAARPYLLREGGEYVLRDLGGDLLHLPSQPGSHGGADREAFDAYLRADFGLVWELPFEVEVIRQLKSDLTRASKGKSSSSILASFHPWGEALIAPDRLPPLRYRMGSSSASPWCPGSTSIHVRMPSHAILTIFDNLFVGCVGSHGVQLNISLCEAKTAVLSVARDFDVSDDGGAWRKKASNYPFRVTNVALGRAPLDGPIVRTDPRPPRPPLTSEEEMYYNAMKLGSDPDRNA